MSTQRQSIHSIHNKKFWTEFFSLYESLPALWDMNNPLYKNRQIKGDAYDVMVDKLREIEPNSDREDVLRKINIFRTNFRRECSRINTNIQQGRQYQSTLWYFDSLYFLQTADTRRERKRKLDDDGEKSIMRKRRPNDMIPTKSTDQYIASKKGHLIEYQPNSKQDYEYDLEEEPDFDYVTDDIEHGLVDGKRDTTNITSEMQQNPLEIQNNSNYEEDEDEDDETSQQELSQECQNYYLQRNNNIEIELSTENAADEPVPAEESVEINDDSDQQVFDEYVDDNNETVIAPQWCIKASNTQNLRLKQKRGLESSQANISKTNEMFSIESTKYVRDVKTMTTSKCHTFSDRPSQLSESSEILAKSWAIQYDELTHQQKLLARKAINDILFDGCMGYLVIGKNGRVTAGNTDYTNLKSSKESLRHEVESGQVYEQTSSASSTAGVSTTAKVCPPNNEWLKL